MNEGTLLTDAELAGLRDVSSGNSRPTYPELARALEQALGHISALAAVPEDVARLAARVKKTLQEEGQSSEDCCDRCHYRAVDTEAMGAVDALATAAARVSELEMEKAALSERMNAVLHAGPSTSLAHSILVRAQNAEAKVKTLERHHEEVTRHLSTLHTAAGCTAMHTRAVDEKNCALDRMKTAPAPELREAVTFIVEQVRLNEEVHRLPDSAHMAIKVTAGQGRAIVTAFEASGR